jgi:festuclavine dehydrogenase
MTILITGSRGITARRLTALLHPQYPVLVAARSAWTDPTLPPSVAFNWTDETTFENPFAHPQAQESPISAMYIVAPTGEEHVLAGELAFLDFAVKRGVTRFVLLGTSIIPEGGPFMGQVHARLRELGVEWVVLRPSWFMG